MDTKQAISDLTGKYKYLVTWCKMMGSHDYYVQAQLLKAEKLKCENDVIYFDDNKPVYFKDVTNEQTIHYFKVRGLEKK